MKTKRQLISLGLIVFLVITSLFLFAPARAQAASKGVQEVTGSPKKIGNYYFKTDHSGKCLYRANKNGSWKTVPFGENSWNYATDGKTVYTVLRNDRTGTSCLAGCVIANGRQQTLKKLGKNAEDGWSISAAYKNAIYLTKRSEISWTQTAYSWNINKKTLKKAAKKCGISDQSGAWVTADNDLVTDVSARKMSLYKLGANGSMKKVKTLGKYCGTAQFAGGKLYYTVTSSRAMKDAKLYRADKNGKNAKKLHTFQSKDGFVYVYDFGKKKCKVTIDGTNFIYTYKTGKLTKTA